MEFFKRLLANRVKVRAVLLLAGGIGTAVGVLPEGAANVIVDQAEVAVGSILTIWGFFAADRARKEPPK